jgi:type II secretion system protein N
VKKILIAFAAVPFVFWFIWMAFPATTIQSIVEDSAGDGKITIEVQSLKKGFFYTLHIDKVSMKISGKELVSFSNIYGRINPFGLIRMRLDTSINGTIGPGKITGSAVLAKNSVQAKLDYKDVDIQEMPFLKHAGIQGAGTISGRFLVADDKGRVEFVTKNAAFGPADFSGIKVPMNFFSEVTGSLSIERNAIEVVSVSLGGKDIYARLKGVIKNGAADLAMELMPSGPFLENPLFLMEASRYQVSPGYYVIPVRGNIPL